MCDKTQLFISERNIYSDVFVYAFCRMTSNAPGILIIV